MLTRLVGIVEEIVETFLVILEVVLVSPSTMDQSMRTAILQTNSLLSILSLRLKMDDGNAVALHGSSVEWNAIISERLKPIQRSIG